MQLVFGAGTAFAVPILDAFGSAIAVPTPVRVGVMQSMSLDSSADLKQLHGQNSYAVDVARGKASTSGKVSFAQYNSRMIDTLFFGVGAVAGNVSSAFVDSSGSLIPATPFTITVVPPLSGTYGEDLGVVDDQAVPMQKVASAPATGQYSQAGAVYTFAAADTARRVFINYRYVTAGVTTGRVITVNNLAMGASPVNKLVMSSDYQGKRCTLIANRVVFTKSTLLSTKQDDYAMIEMEFSAFADPSNAILTMHMSE